MFRETENKNTTDESQIFNKSKELFHQQKREEKDISEYSDSELFQILDLNNPTDRELEAKLYSLIDKYTDIKDKMGQKLKKFYTNIFDHFFENEDDEINSTYSSSLNEGFQDVLADDSNNENIKYTKNIDYTKGSLNPILKETIKRVVSIDSSFRETTTYPYTTDFTFNLSETLRDVVSLKLYSVHIPYNWYTISKNYGSNFIYIKGITNGINNGIYDYKISVPYGNYNSNTLVTALNSSFQTIKDNNTDISFGTSSINYNSINGKCDIILDIKNNYNETNYYIEFAPDIIGTTISGTASGELISNNIRDIFGFQNQERNYPFNINSELFITTENSSYLLDSSNNYFNIYIYDASINPIDHTISSYANNGTDIIYATIKITLSLTTNNVYSQSEIFADLSNQLLNNQYLLQSNDNEYPPNKISSQISTKKIKVNNVDNSYYCLSIRPNRRLISNIQNQKMVIEFPNESYKNTNSLWTGPTSCFKFKTYIMELQNIYSEIQSPITTYIVNSTPSSYIFLKCMKEGYNTTSTNNDTSYNDYRIDISNSPLSGYTLNEYVSVINSSMTNLSRNTNGMIICSMNYNNNKKYDISTNIKYEIDVANFNIVIKNKWLLKNLYNETNDFTISGETNYIKQNTFAYQSGYDISYDEIFTIKSCGNKNKNVSPIDVSFSTTPTEKDISTIVNSFNNSIKYFNDTSNNKNIKLPDTELSYVTNNNFVTLTLKIGVNAILTNTDYKLIIQDPSNKLQETFGYELSYNDLTQVINGQNQLGSNLLALDNSNNFLYIKPIYDVSGGVYTNNNDNIIKIKLDLPTLNQYTKEQVRDSINRVLALNPITKGSYINTDNPITLFRLNINKTFTAKDYSIVFFDSTSFTRCNFGQNSSVETTTIDTTLGWILGFRSNTIYYPTFENLNNDIINNTTYYSTYSNEYTYNNSNGIIKLSGDTSVNVNLYNYFLIVLDDYTQNHLNDGLVTTINADADIPLPSYASKVNYKCDPETGSIVISNIYNSTNYNSLTNAQIYSANQILNTQQQKSAKNIQSSGPFIQDIFGLVPVKINGLSYGQTYTEFGGTLQIQERIYFGPVNIRRMTVKLMSDKGNVLDLNGQNWSFSLIAEQLYNPNKG